MQDTIPAWASSMVFDTIVFVLSLLQAFNGFYSKGRLCSVLIRDGNFWYLGVSLFWFSNCIYIRYSGAIYYFVITGKLCLPSIDNNLTTTKYIVISLANLIQFILTGSNPSGLTGCVMPLLRTSMSVVGCRIILNLRGVSVGVHRASCATTQSIPLISN